MVWAQTSHLEHVVISVCKAMNDADFVATGNEKVTNKQCKILDSQKRGTFYTINAIFKSAWYVSFHMMFELEVN